jgi:hypothetical protein
MPVRVIHHRPEGLGKSRTRHAQFLPVQNRKPMQQVLAVRREFYQDLAMIIISVPAPQCTALNQTIDKFHRTVMAKAELARERSNRGADALGQTFDGQEELMLLRFDAPGSGYLLAGMQELPNTMTELSESAEASG